MKNIRFLARNFTGKDRGRLAPLEIERVRRQIIGTDAEEDVAWTCTVLLPVAVSWAVLFTGGGGL